MLNKKNKIDIDGDGNITFQDIKGSTITVNINDPKEIRLFLIQFQNRLNELPGAILEKLKENQDMESEIKVGANVYITALSAINMQTHKIQSLSLSVQVTNLTKEIRYFGRPYFKTDPILNLIPGNDAFLLLESDRTEWPVRLEYGQVLSCNFAVKQGFLDLLKERLDPDSATMKAFITSTVGELYESNDMPIELFFRRLE